MKTKLSLTDAQQRAVDSDSPLTEAQQVLPLFQPQEIWKPVIGYEGLYEVSCLGNVRSTGNVPGRFGKMAARTMTRTISGKMYKRPGKGYWQVHLTKNRSGKLLRVCRLVAMVFVPNPMGYPHVDHVDGNPRNDAATNLDWVTNRENQIRAVKTGLHRTVRGENQPTHVVTAEQVLAILRGKKPSRATAREFGISKTQVLRIRNRESWRHI